jgi:hypothetical protein
MEGLAEVGFASSGFPQPVKAKKPATRIDFKNALFILMLPIAFQIFVRSMTCRVSGACSMGTRLGVSAGLPWGLAHFTALTMTRWI